MSLLPSLRVCPLVLLLTLAALPSADAQVEYGIVSQSEGLLPQATNALEVVTDATGDVDHFPVGLGEMPTDGTVDIVSMSVAETEDRFLFSVKHRDYDPLMNTLQNFRGMGWYSCWGNFAFNNDETFGYSFSLYLNSDEMTTSRFYGDAHMWERRGDRGYGEWLGEVPVALVGDDHVELSVDKTPMRVGKDGRSLAVGDRMTNIEIDCFRASLPFFFGVYDSAGRDGDSLAYKVTMASGSDMVAGRFVDDDGEPTNGWLTLSAGSTQKAPVLLTNLRDSRLIVNLSASVVDDAGKPLAGWTAVVAPSLEIPGAGEQQATVFVTAPKDAVHRDSARLVIDVKPLGSDQRARIARTVSATVAPGPDNDVLYFHSTPWGSGCFVCIGGNELMPVDFGSEYFVMNVLKQDPDYGEATHESRPLRLQPDEDDAMAFLDMPLGAPVRIAANDELQLTLGFATEVERDVIIRATIMAEDEAGLLAQGEQAARIGASTTVTLALPTGPDVVEIPSGGWFMVSIDVEEVHPVPQTVFTVGTGAGIDWVTSASQLKMPLLAVDSDSFDLTDGTALPTIQLRNNTERDTYINPGKTHAFDLRLVNEGVKADKLTVTVTSSDPTWPVQVEPGRKFALTPGQSAPFSVLLTAPDDAPENLKVLLNLTATSDNDDRVRTTFLLSATATAHPIEANAYTPPPVEEAVAPIDESERDSPAPVAPLFVLASLAALAVARRRR